MKALKFYSIFWLSALFVLSACDKDEPASEDGSPVLTVDPTTLTVSGEGGVVSVDYQVENPVEGATVSVDLGSVTWITVDVTDSTIDLTVEANPEDDSRTATLSVSYPGANDVSLSVVQDVVQYDYEFSLEDFFGYLYDGEGSNGEDMYLIWLSDIGFDNYGNTQEGGHYYTFYFFVNEASGNTVPTGTYTPSTDYGGDMVFATYSRYYEFDSSYTAYITDGTLTVSADGDTFTIEGVVTDENGAAHRIYYNGPAEVETNTPAG